MPFSRVFGLLAIILPLAAEPCPAAGIRLPTSATWATDAAWSGGSAEIATYTATRPFKGKPVSYEATLVVLLKWLDPRSLAPVSDATRRPSMLPVLELSALHPGEGDGMQQLSLRSVDLLEDQIPLTLRGLDFEQRPEFMVRLLPTMASGHGGPVKWRKAGIKVTGPETIDVPFGEVSTWKVYVDTATTMSAWWFAVDGTHPLIRMESSEGVILALASLERRGYESN